LSGARSHLATVLRDNPVLLAICRSESPSRWLIRLILPIMSMVITPVSPLPKKNSRDVEHLAHFYFSNAAKYGSIFGSRQHACNKMSKVMIKSFFRSIIFILIIALSSESIYLFFNIINFATCCQKIVPDAIIDFLLFVSIYAVTLFLPGKFIAITKDCKKITFLVFLVFLALYHMFLLLSMLGFSIYFICSCAIYLTIYILALLLFLKGKVKTLVWLLSFILMCIMFVFAEVDIVLFNYKNSNLYENILLCNNMFMYLLSSFIGYFITNKITQLKSELLARTEN